MAVATNGRSGCYSNATELPQPVHGYMLRLIRIVSRVRPTPAVSRPTPFSGASHSQRFGSHLGFAMAPKKRKAESEEEDLEEEVSEGEPAAEPEDDDYSLGEEDDDKPKKKKPTPKKPRAPPKSKKTDGPWKDADGWAFEPPSLLYKCVLCSVTSPGDAAGFLRNLTETVSTMQGLWHEAKCQDRWRGPGR